MKDYLYLWRIYLHHKFSAGFLLRKALSSNNKTKQQNPLFSNQLLTVLCLRDRLFQWPAFHCKFNPERRAPTGFARGWMYRSLIGHKFTSLTGLCYKGQWLTIWVLNSKSKCSMAQTWLYNNEITLLLFFYWPFILILC